MTTPRAFAAPRLRRLAARAGPSPGGASHGTHEVCDLCAQPIPPDHRHLLEAGSGDIACGCPACALLFDRADAEGARYRLVPDTRRRLDGRVIDDATWAGLGIPVGLAFFTRPSGSDAVHAAYPSPLGLMRSVVAPESWAGAEAACPALAAMTPDVEALLVNRVHSEPRHWLVPLDDCYRLAALVRAHWKGLGGGDEVWQQVDGFFQALTPGPARGAGRTGPASGEGPAHDTQEASWASP
ncbi:DUF5947 family protein [Streptomyces sp. HNM0663]|uniref:DUF5947 family protein n=1 Tax=Streptomyces chengmaiensis TaxID=3040919 RepID=A0ABT6HS15_9ACTN|nr:DUF5947 family protein [Streptomyces chengmaiensis]MDH2390834.1 DUF5947 family protein [Streptomyces chengmaiensis]